MYLLQAALAPASHAEGDDDHDEEGLPKKKGAAFINHNTEYNTTDELKNELTNC